jgi:Ca2+-binding EF-hand superfamily protein
MSKDSKKDDQKKMREIEQCFLLYDYPAKGKIPNTNLIKLMRNLGTNASDDELKELYKKVDPSGSGSFGMAEFKALMVERIQSAGTQEELKAAFELFDRDSDGVLTITDLQKCAEFLKVLIGKEDLKSMFEKADSDKDGKITFEDFCALLS